MDIIEMDMARKSQLPGWLIYQENPQSLLPLLRSTVPFSLEAEVWDLVGPEFLGEGARERCVRPCLPMHVIYASLTLYCLDWSVVSTPQKVTSVHQLWIISPSVGLEHLNTNIKIKTKETYWHVCTYV